MKKTHISKWLCVLLLLLSAVYLNCEPEETGKAEPVKEQTAPVKKIDPSSFPPEPVRNAVFQGTWYPGDAELLKKQVNAYLKNAKKPSVPSNTKPRIVIAPHAGYIYCWNTAAHAFRALQGQTYDIVVLVGLCHRYPLGKISVYKQGSYKNCLGSLRVNSSLAEKLIQADDIITSVPAAHAQEHSLEILLPFIQVILGEVPIVPILIQTRDPEAPKKLAKALHKTAKDLDILLLISTDLSHFSEADDARKVDKKTVESWKTLDPNKIKQTSEKQLAQGIDNLSCTMCGEEAVLTGFEFAKLRNINTIQITHLSNSADASKDNSRTVGYASGVLYEKTSGKPSKGKTMSEEFLSEESKKELLAIARKSVESAVSRKPLPDDKSDNPQLQKKAGCFVTLKNKESLRGCIGCFESGEPLYQTIRKYAAISSTQDTRFASNPITPKEVPDLTIEISVLTPMKKVKDPEKEIKLGVHGIYIKKGFRSGTYLPQVATDHNMSFEEFMGSCCAHKAGLPRDAWKTDPEVEIYTYEAIVFHE
ncbi:AmmeMemoRadiSam system protein B [Planctomycetota bacterium]